MTLHVNQDTLPLLVDSAWPLPQIIERAYQIESKIRPLAKKITTLSNPHIILTWFIEQELLQARFKIVMDHAKTISVQNYVQSHARAIWAAYSLPTGISTGLTVTMKEIFEIHNCFFRQEGGAGQPGMRNTDLWVGPRERGQTGAFLVPLPVSQIKNYFEDLILFQSRSNLPVTIKSAIFYTQFLMIHPFSDANGRTARTTASIILNRGLNINPTIFSCAHLLEKRQFDYIQTSHEILICGNWVPYLCLFLDVVEQCAEDLNILIESLAQIDSEIRSLDLGSHFKTSLARRVLFRLLESGECSHKELKKTLNINNYEYQTVLNELLKFELVKSTKIAIQSTRLGSLLWKKNWKEIIEIHNLEEQPAGLVPIDYNPI